MKSHGTIIGLSLFAVLLICGATKADQLTAGGKHACLIQSGTLYCWGDNTYGQLGTGDNNYRDSPTQIGSSGEWDFVSAGEGHTCGIKTNGNLYCWGRDTYGQVGDDGSNSNQNAPQVVATIGASGDWNMISAGLSHTCGVRGTNAVYCWGRNNTYQLGQGVGDTTDRDSPVAVIGYSAEWVSAGGDNTCGFSGIGYTSCWGGNASGDLGLNSAGASESPSGIYAPGQYFIGISASTHNHVCAIEDGNFLFCWGENSTGELGEYYPSDIDEPTWIGSDYDWDEVTTAPHRTCARKTDDTIYCWGENDNGPIGDGTETDATSGPIQIGTDSDWAAIATGGTVNDPGFTCALKTGGDLYCWGDNAYSQLGLGPTQTTSFAQIGTASTWSLVSSGDTHSCAINSSDELFCWGQNDYGQLGIGTTVDKYEPQKVNNDTNWLNVSAGAEHTCAVKSTGTLWCWGRNDQGQIGKDPSSTTYASTPQQETNSWTNWKSVGAGGKHSCGLKKSSDSGKVFCWGDNQYGQLGNSTTTDSWSPVRSGTITSLSLVAAGSSHSCAFGDGISGHYCWGLNSSGQIGDGTTTNRTAPRSVSISGGNNGEIDGLAAGGDTTCAIEDFSTNKLRCWGENSNGQVGNNSTTDATSPTEISLMSGVTAIAVGSLHTCGIKSSKLYCWGDNGYGQLGLGDTTDRDQPAQVGSATDWSRVSTGNKHTVARKTGSTIYLAGGNLYTEAIKLMPTLVP